MWFANPSSQWTLTTYSLPISRRTLQPAFGYDSRFVGELLLLAHTCCSRCECGNHYI